MGVKLRNDLSVDEVNNRFVLFTRENQNILSQRGGYNYYHYKDYTSIVANYSYYQDNKYVIALDSITNNIYANESLLSNILWAHHIVRSEYAYGKLIDKFANYTGPFDVQFIASIELLFDDNFIVPADISEKIVLTILDSMKINSININTNTINLIFAHCFKFCGVKNMSSRVAVEFRNIIENYNNYFNFISSREDVTYKVCEFLEYYPELCSIKLLESLKISRWSARKTLATILYNRSVSLECLVHIKYMIISACMVNEYIDAINDKISRAGGIAKFLPLYTMEDFYKDLPDDYRLGVII